MYIHRLIENVSQPTSDLRPAPEESVGANAGNWPGKGAGAALPLGKQANALPAPATPQGNITDTDQFFGFQAGNAQTPNRALYISYRRRDSVDIGTGVALEIRILYSVAFPKERIVATNIQQLEEDLVDATLAGARLLITAPHRHLLDEVLAQSGYTREQLRDPVE